MYTHTHARTHPRTHARTHPHTHTHRHTHTQTHSHAMHMHIHMHTQLHGRTFTTSLFIYIVINHPPVVWDTTYAGYLLSVTERGEVASTKGSLSSRCVLEAHCCDTFTPSTTVGRFEQVVSTSLVSSRHTTRWRTASIEWRARWLSFRGDAPEKCPVHRSHAQRRELNSSRLTAYATRSTALCNVLLRLYAQTWLSTIQLCTRRLSLI